MNTISRKKKIFVISLQIFRSYFIIILYRSLMVGCLTFGRSHVDGEYIFKHLKPCSNMRALLQWMQRLEEGKSRETACSGRGGGKVWSVSKWWWRNCILLLKVCLFVEGEGGGLSVTWSRHLWKMKRSWGKAQELRLGLGLCYYRVLLWPGAHLSPWSHETDRFSVGKIKACSTAELLLQHVC